MNLQQEAAANLAAHQILTNIADAAKRPAGLPVPDVLPASWEAWDQAVEALDDWKPLQFYRPGAFSAS